MRSFFKFFYFVLLALLSFSVEVVKASQKEIEEKEVAVQGAKDQSSGLPPELSFDIIGHVLKFSELQTFYRFKLVSKGWKQATKKKSIKSQKETKLLQSC
jgi:hypothetical protein